MKRSRLLEIVKEEIQSVLNEISTIDVPGDPRRMSSQQKKSQIDRARSQGDRTLGTPTNPVEFVEEEQLNEAPIYDVNDMEGFKSTLDKFREEGLSKSKALNLLLKKLEDEGTVDTNALSKEQGVDTATFNNMDIRKFLNRKKDEVVTNPKTGEELLDFSPYLDKSDKKRGKVAGEKPERKEIPDFTPKSKPASKAEPKKSEPAAKKAEPKKAEPKKPEAKKPETKKPEPKPDAKGTKLGDKKDELLNAKTKLENERKKLMPDYNAATGTEKEKIVDKLKELTRKLETVNKEIDKL
jgi:hypothetical protein